MAAQLLDQAKGLFQTDELPEALGWVSWLSESHQRLLAGELYAALTAGESEGSVAELLDAWKATAELDHAPGVRDQLERNRTRNRWSSVDEWPGKRRDIA